MSGIWNELSDRQVEANSIKDFNRKLNGKLKGQYLQRSGERDTSNQPLSHRLEEQAGATFAEYFPYFHMGALKETLFSICSCPVAFLGIFDGDRGS